MNHKPGAIYQASTRIHVYWCSFEEYLNAESEAFLVFKNLAARAENDEYFLYIGGLLVFPRSETFIRLKTNQIVWMRDFATTYLELVSE